MYNASRRNRNIGTAKQRQGKDNKMVVPYPAVEMKAFFERLGTYKTVEKEINDHTFRFVVEKTRETSFHACTIEDIAKVLAYIPKADYGDLNLIILRQPSRKEEQLVPVWGRLIYSYDFEGDYQPAIIIEAVDLKRSFKRTKKLSVEGQKELERLRKDGHKIKEGKRFFEAEFEIEHIRATQLYRTLLHEFGHYVHYLQVVELAGEDDEDLEAWSKRIDQYHNLPSNEKEVFAHTYADRLKIDLEARSIIPFSRILDEEQIVEHQLYLGDFKKRT